MLPRYLAALALGFELVSPAVAAPLDLEPWMTERRIIGDDNLEPVESLQGTPEYDFVQTVARLEVMEGYGFCTGSRVGENLFLTNYHCDLGCDSTIFRLGYQNNIPTSDQTSFRCVQLLVKNEVLDYALFEASPPTGDFKTYPILSLSRSPVQQNRRAIVASHPSGRSKVVDRSAQCVISDPTIIHTDSGRDTMKHTCDTDGGSSGAPVIDFERGTAIGLHWGGKGNEYNYAVPMTKIVEDLESKLPPEVFARLQVTDH